MIEPKNKAATVTVPVELPGAEALKIDINQHQYHLPDIDGDQYMLARYFSRVELYKR
jgi:hypothetical protein